MPCSGKSTEDSSLGKTSTHAPTRLVTWNHPFLADGKRHQATYSILGVQLSGIIYMFIIYTYIPLCVIICQLLGIIIYPYSQARSSKIFIPLLKLNTYHPPPFRPRLKAVLNLAGWQYVSDFNDYFDGNHQHSAPFVEKPPTK